MYYAIIYSRGQGNLQPSRPVIPATAANEGQSESGTRNSIWRSTKRTEIAKRLAWRSYSNPSAQQPSRPATVSDVDIEVTSSDGSIWTAKKTISSAGDARWIATGRYSDMPGNVVSGQVCSPVNSYGYSRFGMLNGAGEDAQYPEYMCRGDVITSYLWELSKIRKHCNECPPVSITEFGDECACDNTVYKVVEEEYSVDIYYWKLESDTSILAITTNAIIKAITFELNERAYEDDTGSVGGVLDNDIADPFIFEIRDSQEKHVYSGLIKNWKFKDNYVNFNIVDFRTTLNTDVLIDYSSGDSDFRVFKVFEKLTAQVSRNSQQFIYEFNYPIDSESTIAVANYSGQYIIVNAQAFLKIYISYYNYVIDKRYDYTRDVLVFTFRKRSESITEIRLDDFTHDRTKNDVKTNKVIATIKFQTIYDVDTEWTITDETAFITAPTESKSIIISDELPPLEGFEKDQVIKLIKNPYLKQISQNEYENLTNRNVIKIPSSGVEKLGIINRTETTGGSRGIELNPYPSTSWSVYPEDAGQACNFIGSKRYTYHNWNYEGRVDYTITTICEGYMKNVCPIEAPNSNDISEHVYVENYPYDTGFKVEYASSDGVSCGMFSYFKTASENISYYKKGGTIIIPRSSTTATKTYSLGSDNNVYEGNAPQSLTIYPIQTKIFENDTLAKAQIDAIYHLVSNRWNENIILNDIDRPLELSKLFLINMIRVYDTNGTFKDLPISEKSSIYKEGNLLRKVKLGFKKELFTQIYKGDTNVGVFK